ncbi:helix-turn-helix transcriptional regulator [Nocardia fluminea]|uniref:helix-turn-helix transcriptional regulator n=1 Tax=Nocardia fluminea TaxID=134984 RepID=UPI003D096488
MLIGVSVDYIVRLEQGRGPKPSEQVLGALTRALRLTDVDRDLVFRLAGSEPPQAGRIPMAIRPSVLRLLDRQQCRCCVGCLRAVKAAYPGDPGLSRLLTELRTGRPEFEEHWQAGRSSAMHSLTKTIAHPDLGALTLDCDAMHVPDTDQTIIIYSATPHTPTATALDLLRVTGLESFATPTTE